MATYLVLRRTNLRGVSVAPGKLIILEDAEAAFRLIERNLLLPVPDNYPGTLVRLPASAESSPSVSRSGDEGSANDPTPATRPVAKVRSKSAPEAVEA